jgi:hypothetical protein
MSNKQTAVEWLAEKYNYITWLRNRDEISSSKADEWRTKYLEQAKETHKEEMVMFVLNVIGKYRHGDVLAEIATELYEQTYGGGEQ